MTTLTKEDLQALRHADSIVFRTDPTGTEIVCSLKVKINQLAGEITHTIKCEHTHAGYSPDRSRTKLYKAVYVDMYLQTTPEAPWNTISKQLRQGDQLTLCWRSDNNNQYIDKADLHVDDLTLEVTRQRKTQTKLYFPVGFSICAENSARMIQLI